MTQQHFRVSAVTLLCLELPRRPLNKRNAPIPMDGDQVLDRFPHPADAVRQYLHHSRHRQRASHHRQGRKAGTETRQVLCCKSVP
ncbi:MAG: hypothetical protein BWY25_02957 [Chloroflexi bacterium ADurb.Bin222]|nr:MAG: hypothetical protein BWY25_02957 [Chloroflexi bacterium ADurb.Bin222]